jgi:glutamyl/glutaminyl-tRNA synthetase
MQAMNFNFGQARIADKQGLGGETILRFDDTNPVRSPRIKPRFATRVANARFAH